MFQRTTFLSQLVQVVGSEHVLADAELRASYEVDWTRRWKGTACAVVRPGTPDEVAGILEISRSAGVAVVPQGGNTGLVGGSVPSDGALLLSLRRLGGVWDIDSAAGEASVGAGTTLTELQTALKPVGQELAVELASRETATVGGMVATNAGGSRAMRYGSMGAQLIGLSAVLADGTRISRMPGLRKDSCGYDLASMLVGSEGTLGVVDAVRVRTVPIPPWICAALVGTSGIDEAITVLAGVQRLTDCLRAAEFVSADAMQLVCDYLGCGVPVRTSAAYVMFEWAASTSRLDEVARGLAQLQPDKTAVGEDPRRSALWRFREQVPEAIATQGIPHKFDVSLPVANIARFLERAGQIVQSHSPDAKAYSFGHLADGNVHLNVIGLAADDMSIDSSLLDAVTELGGSIGAEHGIGRAKVDSLHLVRSADELALLGRIKDTFDPAGLLNPGVILPGPGRGQGSPCY